MVGGVVFGVGAIVGAGAVFVAGAVLGDGVVFGGGAVFGFGCILRAGVVVGAGVFFGAAFGFVDLGGVDRPLFGFGWGGRASAERATERLSGGELITRTTSPSIKTCAISVSRSMLGARSREADL